MEKHEAVYRNLRKEGHQGWGGNKYEDRMKGLDNNLIELMDFLEIKQGKALELGSGAGDLSIKLHDLGFDVTGVEISETAVEWARQKAGNIRFIHQSVTESQLLENETFDLILDGNCLHCLFDDDRVKLYDNISRLLKPEGYFYVASVIANNEGDSALVGPIPRCFLTKDQLLQELEFHGFECLKSWTKHHEKHGHFRGVFKNI